MPRPSKKEAVFTILTTNDFASDSYCASMLGISRRQAQRYMKQLRAAGDIANHTHSYRPPGHDWINERKTVILRGAK